MSLDHKSLMSCREVNKNWKYFLDNPRFWFNKCKQKGLSTEVHKDWNNLIKILNDTSLEQNLTLCLIKLHKKNSLFFRPPLFMASELNDRSLVQFILENVDPCQSTDKYGNTPIHMAAKYGHIGKS